MPPGKLARVNATDVDAPCNSDLAIDNQHFAVILMREGLVLVSIQRIDRIEFDDMNSPVPQALEERRVIHETAHAVMNEIDMNTFRPFFSTTGRKIRGPHYHHR